MVKSLCLVFGLLSGVSLSAQSSTFPASWLGEYSGNMILAFAERPNDTIPVIFEIKELEKDSIWTYKMTYNSAKYGVIVKDYRIVAATKGNQSNYFLDELNGILMELTLMNNCFYGVYEVMGDLYTSTFRLKDDDFFFELFMSHMENPKISYTEANEDTPAIEAKSMKPVLVQSASLKRTN